MTYYTLFSKNGKALAVACSSNIISDINNDEILIEGMFDSNHYYDDVIKQVVLKTPRPSEFHYFDYEKKSWELDSVFLIEDIRNTRNALLKETDWTQMPDIPDNLKDKWKDYRQQLRDITKQVDKLNLIWPVEPV